MKDFWFGHDNEASGWRGLNVRTKVAIELSVVWVAMSLFLTVALTGFDFENTNELGDWLAGIFAPVALIWLVAGYYQQAHDLLLQKRSLDEQIAESKQLVRATREQLDYQVRVNRPIVTEAYSSNEMGAPIKLKLVNGTMTGLRRRSGDVTTYVQYTSRRQTGPSDVPCLSVARPLATGDVFEIDIQDESQNWHTYRFTTKIDHGDNAFPGRFMATYSGYSRGQ